ncbi:MAG: heme exporter protein CcmD [SAR324 cluster bacterium]|nr:heme exporter protein CcmD [SAR324 cluster bacterium]MDP7462883.1 heme exporter protein CcmD [SAR324 cluster bacterium]MDP7629372.1 heme exporter protein CcmD [SAR324 cluster bacterium]
MPDNTEYVLLSYGVWIAAFVAYLLWTWNRQRTCQQQLEDLRLSRSASSSTQSNA